MRADLELLHSPTLISRKKRSVKKVSKFQLHCDETVRKTKNFSISKLYTDLETQICYFGKIKGFDFSFSTIFSPSKRLIKTHQNLDSNKPGRVNRCVASRIGTWPKCPRLKSPFLADNP